MSASQFMRAVRITGHGGPEVLELTEVAVPAPRAGEVLVQVSPPHRIGLLPGACGDGGPTATQTLPNPG